MIEIDGSQGEGGGQIVRSSLALSLLTGKSFRISNIRAGRRSPGLKRQHLTAIRAAAEVGNATLVGDELGSNQIVFEPNSLSAGHFNFEIATAGSATLVLQTVLPALMLGQQSSTVSLRGGTHNMMAPPFDFLKHSFVPALEDLGPRVELELRRHGFYPAGGGEFTARITPTTQLKGSRIQERGKLVSREVHAIVSQIPVSVAKRETDRVIRKLNWDRAKAIETEVENPRGPGNILFVKLEYENVTSVFCSFGKMGVTAERVADQVVRLVREYLKSEAPVGPFLADQIMLPMAIAAWKSGTASQITTMPLTGHSQTQIDVIRNFLDINVENEQHPNGNVTVNIY